MAKLNSGLRTGAVDRVNQFPQTGEKSIVADTEFVMPMLPGVNSSGRSRVDVSTAVETC